jgi:hypothetical protein
MIVRTVAERAVCDAQGQMSITEDEEYKIVFGRRDKTCTCNPTFWRLVLYPLSDTSAWWPGQDAHVHDRSQSLVACQAAREQRSNQHGRSRGKAVPAVCLRCYGVPAALRRRPLIR